jgi:hypothetical protein
MKKIISIIFSVCLVLNLSAQEGTTPSGTSEQSADQTSGLVSKKGIAILPEKGEFSLGIDATPFLNYLGSVIMNWGSGYAAPSISVPSETYAIGISAKYMLSNKSALRLNFYTNETTQKDYYSVAKSDLTPNLLSPQYVEDVVTSNNESSTLTIGLEMRRGKSRVQGIYGIDAILGTNNSQVYYDYGNDMTVDFTTPAIAVNSYGSLGERLIRNTTTNNFIFGARGFIGVEFFVGPKLSLGGELGYTVRYRTESRSQYKYEYWDTEQLRIENIYRDNTSTKGYSQFGIVTNTSGNLKINFYF